MGVVAQELGTEQTWKGLLGYTLSLSFFLFILSISFLYMYTLLLPILIPLLVLGADLCIRPTLVQTTNLPKLGGRVVVSCMYQRVDRGEATGKLGAGISQTLHPAHSLALTISWVLGFRVY